MKKRKVVRILIVLFITCGCVLSGFAQDYTQWSLPEETKTRIGKGFNLDVRYSPDGSLLAVASSIGIWLYDAQSGQELDLLAGHIGVISSVSFSPDGKTIASGNWKHTVQLWEVETGVEKDVFRGHTSIVYSVSFSPDGKTLASGSNDNTVRLWDVETGAEKLRFIGHTGAVQSVSFSPDGKTLASGSNDSTVRLWDIQTGVEKHIFRGHTRTVSSVSFSPDGSHLQVAVMITPFVCGTLMRT